MWDAMLGKGFKASKCKTLLRLAMARIKLLRNKRDIQVKQLRKDIAQLLTTGQEPSARIRVEHIIREQNILAAYDVLELFCELVAVRLPIIEAQKVCPMDLKEAISSLIFASPRCADLPELLQIRALFAAKYGKEFAAAAAELRPDCGVNRRIIEKLSVIAPAGDIKLKLLKEIAAEHNLDWDPTDTEAELLKNHEDLLDGPNHFIGASDMPLEKPQVPSVPTDVSIKDSPAPSVPFQSGSTQLSSTSGIPPHDIISDDDERQFVPFGSRPPPGKSETPPLTKPLPRAAQDNDGIKEKLPRLEPTADSYEDPYAQVRGEGNTDYIDVAAAAKAAADSADRAVAAARAAAELARKHMDHGVKEPRVIAEEDSSDTDLDSDNDDGANVTVPVKAEASRSRPVAERKPAVAFDSDSDGEEYDVPRGRGAGGTKGKPPVKRYNQIDTQGAYDNPVFPSGVTKLEFGRSETPSKLSFDDRSRESEDSVFFKSARTGKQERENRSYGGDSTSGKYGDDAGEPHELKWHSREEPERYDIFDINREEPANPYSAYNSNDYNFGKSSVDVVEDDDDSKSGKKYPSFDNPYAGDTWKAKPGPKSREGSPLFDEEGSVGRSRERSRLGSVPPRSAYDDQYDASPVSSPPKSGFDDFNSSAKIGFGSWAQRGPPTSDLPPTRQKRPTEDSTSLKDLMSAEDRATDPTQSTPKLSAGEDLIARFEALKAKG